MLYKVKVNYYNDLDEKNIPEYGIFVADDYADCLSIVKDLYSENYLEEITMKPISPDNCILFTESEVADFENISNMIEEGAIW